MTAPALELPDAASQSAEQVLAGLESGPGGLTSAAVAERRAEAGPNAVRDHRARALQVLVAQLRSPLLVLLIITAGASYFLGERTDAAVIGLILAASVGLGFGNEYRAERASQALHDRVRHTVVALRDGQPVRVDVVDLVPGDVIELELGAVVPADVRVIEAVGLECDESVVTGESMPVPKGVAPTSGHRAITDLSSCALMGTVIHAGSGAGVVVATGARTEFGRIATGLGTRQPETEFQAGLRRFSFLLMQVAAVLTVLILLANVLLHRRLIDAVLFSLAIAVGVTPQLLPAIVSASLAAGSRRLARANVLVKRLVCIEDLGDLDVLLTDKTGTLTQGQIKFTSAIDAAGAPDDRVLTLGLLASDVSRTGTAVVGGNPLDMALFDAPGTATQSVAAFRRLHTVPFDHERRMSSVVVQPPEGPRLLVCKGAPESVLARCTGVPGPASKVLDRLFAAGERVVAVACRNVLGEEPASSADERNLTLAGFLTFADLPRPDAAESLARLAALGTAVKIATGDNPIVARTVCERLGLTVEGVLTGPDLDTLDEGQLVDVCERTTIFARISPEQKAIVVRALRGGGRAVGFLGDGVNDALALHAADVGISVDTATDVAKDAADVILLDKDLGVLADGIEEGRRTFANTIKYVLMGTSSNFGNMFSAAGASAVLPFLPMLPSQVLLNNLLYDLGQLAIPTDSVDPEQLQRPSHWDIRMIRRFMLFFGPISSIFDFLTFSVMLGLFHAGPALFRSGWFVESIATQTLVVFAVRTRRVPSLRSRPSRPLMLSVFAVVAVAVSLPFTPVADRLGFRSLPADFFAVLAGMVVCYLLLVEVGKRVFYAEPHLPPRPRIRGPEHRQQRRAARFTHAG